MSTALAQGRRRIIVVGGGFGGAFAVQRLARRLHDAEAEVVESVS
jgi:NADH dehydrogenase FAD-containing subunit